MKMKLKKWVDRNSQFYMNIVISRVLIHMQMHRTIWIIGILLYSLKNWNHCSLITHNVATMCSHKQPSWLAKAPKTIPNVTVKKRVMDGCYGLQWSFGQDGHGNTWIGTSNKEMEKPPFSFSNCNHNPTNLYLCHVADSFFQHLRLNSSFPNSPFSDFSI